MKIYHFGAEDAPVLLLLPGTCCHWKSNFGAVIPLLADSFRVLCVSYDGFDETEQTEFPTMLEETEKIEAYLKTTTAYCDTWHDYEMDVAPYENSKPIYYEFTTCPAAEFAKRFGFADIMPALCNVDYASMELLHAKLVRTTTCVDGCRCDYTICGDKDPYVKEHPEYRDENGYRRNK